MRELDQFAIDQENLIANITNKPLKFSKYHITERSVGLLVASLNSIRVASLIVAQCKIDKPLEAFTILAHQVPLLTQLRIEGMWFESDTNIGKQLLQDIVDKRAEPLAVRIVWNYSSKVSDFLIFNKVRKARDEMEIRVPATEQNGDFNREYFAVKKKKPRQVTKPTNGNSVSRIVKTKQPTKFVAYTPKDGGVSWADQFADDEPTVRGAISTGR